MSLEEAIKFLFSAYPDATYAVAERRIASLRDGQPRVHYWLSVSFDLDGVHSRYGIFADDIATGLGLVADKVNEARTEAAQCQPSLVN